MTLLEALSSHDTRKLALVDEHKKLTYGDLLETVEEFSGRLKNYSCVGLAMDNSVEWLIWDIAALKSGIVLVPIPPFFTKEQTEHALKTSGCDALITKDGIKPLLFSAVALPQKTTKITFTSGTTGTPKGVCLSSEALENVAINIVTTLGMDLAGEHCCVLPLGILLENIAGAYAALFAGATITLPSLQSFGKNYSLLYEQLKKYKATSVILVPEILRILMGQAVTKAPLKDLEFIAVGGSKISPELLRQAQLMKLPVYEGYGLSECGSVVSLNIPSKNKIGSVGRLLPHMRAEIVNNEIIILNPSFCGYIGEPHHGPFPTGDIGNIDAEGYITITGRKKNILITSYGRNISPEWVEAALLKEDGIAQVFVYGDGQPHLSALIVPVSTSTDIYAMVARVNMTLPDYARVKDYTITAPFSFEEGTLTGNGRLRRDMIIQKRLTQEKNHAVL